MTARGSVLAWLGHPVTVAAVVVLVLNDRLLKAAHPGLVTGKLSDVAGLVVAPALLAAVIGLVLPWPPDRAVAASSVAVTGIGFTLTKGTVAGAEFASAAWSVLWPSHVRADPTDLLALPALCLAWWVWRRTRDAPVPERAVRLFRVCVALPLAVLAVAGTSAVDYPTVERVWVGDGRLYASGSGVYHTSGDGITWTRVDPPRGYGPPVIPPPTEAPPRTVPRPSTVSRQSCVQSSPQHCFRVVPGRLAVDESTDGARTWRRAWEVSEGRREFLARDMPEVEPVNRNLVSAEVAVLAVRDGFVVAVANQRDGLAVRRADGTWRRTWPPFDGWPPTDRRPADLTAKGQRIIPEYLLGLLAGALVLGAVAMGVAARRRAYLAGGAALAVCGLALMPLALWAYVFSTSEVLLLSGAAAAVTGAGLWIYGLVTGSGVRWWNLVLGVAVSVATAVAVVAPFYGWSAGDPDLYDDAARQASLAMAGGLAVAVVISVMTVLLRRRARRE